MGRRRGKTGFDALAALPWPVGVMAGIAGFLAVRDGIPLWFSRHDGALSQAIDQQAEGAFAPMAWILLLLCWLAALASFLKAGHRRRLLDTRTTFESLAAGGWRQFEIEQRSHSSPLGQKLYIFLPAISLYANIQIYRRTIWNSMQKPDQ